MRTRGAKREEYRTPPDLMIASMMQVLSYLPNRRRSEALRRMADVLRDLHDEPGQPMPEFIGMLTDLADKEDGA